MAESLLIKVLTADSSRMSSELLADSLRRSRNPRFEIVLPAGFTSSQTVEQIRRLTPAVAVISSALPDGPFAGFSVVSAVQAERLPTRVVLLLDECERDLVVDAFRAGARGVFFRSEPSERLVRCLVCVHAGQIWAGTRELEFVLHELASARPLHIVDTRGRNLLSKREAEIAALVTDGMTNREISQQLKLSEHTVKNYLFNVFEKLGISTRVELVLYALSQNPPHLPQNQPNIAPRESRE